jgi:hypothetical protein
MCKNIHHFFRSFTFLNKHACKIVRNRPYKPVKTCNHDDTGVYYIYYWSLSMWAVPAYNVNVCKLCDASMLLCYANVVNKIPDSYFARSDRY